MKTMWNYLFPEHTYMNVEGRHSFSAAFSSSFTKVICLLFVFLLKMIFCMHANISYSLDMLTSRKSWYGQNNYVLTEFIKMQLTGKCKDLNTQIRVILPEVFSSPCDHWNSIHGINILTMHHCTLKIKEAKKGCDWHSTVWGRTYIFYSRSAALGKLLRDAT